MDPMQLINKALEHVTVVKDSDVKLPAMINIAVDMDVTVPIQTYRCEDAEAESVATGRYCRNELDNPADPTKESVIHAGEYIMGDPRTERSNDPMGWHWASMLFDASTASFTPRPDGGRDFSILRVKICTHRDPRPNRRGMEHVAIKQLTFMDLLIFIAVADATAKGHEDDVARLLALVSPCNGTYVSYEQEIGIVHHLIERLGMSLIRSGKTFTDVQGASSRHSLWTLDDGTPVTYAGTYDEVMIKSATGDIPIVVDAGVMMTLAQINRIIERDNLSAGKGEALTVVTSYDEILGMRGKESTPKNKSRVRAQIDALRNSSWSFKGENGDDLDISVLSARLFRRNGTLVVNVAPEFMALVIGRNAARIPFDDRMFLIDYVTYKHAWGICWKLTTYYYINYFRKGRNHLSVNKLLAYLKSLPSAEDIKGGDSRHFTRDIILPLERNLNYLTNYCNTGDPDTQLDYLPILKYWKYVHANGEPLTEEEEASRQDGALDYYIATARGANEVYIEWEPTLVDTAHMVTKGERDEESRVKAEAARLLKAEEDAKRQRRIDKKKETYIAKKLAEDELRS